jgi:hypothetical protein
MRRLRSAYVIVAHAQHDQIAGDGRGSFSSRFLAGVEKNLCSQGMFFYGGSFALLNRVCLLCKRKGKETFKLY